MKHLFKKATCLFTVIALCMSVLFPTVLVGAADDNQSCNIDFTKYDLGYPQYSYEGVSIDSEGFNEQNSLKISISDSSVEMQKSKYALLAEKQDTFKLLPKSLYEVTFSYKVVGEVKSDVQMGFYASYEKSPLAKKYRSIIGKTQILASENDSIGNWITKTVFLPVETLIEYKSGELCDSLAIGILADGVTVNVDVYIDNIIVKYQGDLTYYTITFDSQGGSSVESVTSYSGDNIVWPSAPVREGYAFVGWYLDKSCTKICTDTTFIANRTLYAKWIQLGEEAYLFNFDDEIYGNQLYPKDTYLSIDDGEYLSQGKSLRVDGAMPYGVRKTLQKADKSKFKLENKTLYKVTFSYKIDSGLGFIGFYSCNGGSYTDIANFNTKYKLVDYGDWTTATTYFFADFGEYPESKDLAIVFYGATNTMLLDCNIDNLLVEKVQALSDEERYIITDYGDGKNSNYIIGKPNDKIDINTPVREGYTFLSWCESFVPLVQFTDTQIIDNKYITARWARNSIIQDFENYNGYGRGEGYDIDYMIFREGQVDKYSSDFVHSGNTSVRRIGDATATKGISPFDYSIDNLCVSQNYLVSFYVKLDAFNDENGYVYIQGSKSMMYNWQNDGDKIKLADYTELTDGKWHKVTTMVQALTPYIAIYTTGGASVFIDDFRADLLQEGVIPEYERLGVGEGKGRLIKLGGKSLFSESGFGNFLSPITGDAVNGLVFFVFAVSSLGLFVYILVTRKKKKAIEKGGQQ